MTSYVLGPEDQITVRVFAANDIPNKPVQIDNDGTVTLPMIGQVHAATLADGRRVAVKVQYPGVGDAIRADLANTELLATFFQLVVTAMPGLSRMDVRAMAREVSDRIGEEIDYRIEAANQQEFADLYRGHPFIRVPEVLHEYSSRRVLTTELSDGVRYAKALTAEQALRDAWGEAITRFLSASLIVRGVFNADPHPGNYLFHPDGSVTFLDFGCVKRFTRAYVDELVQSVRLTLAQDAAGLHNHMNLSGYLDLVDGVEPTDLLSFMTATYSYLVQAQPYAFTPQHMADTWRVAMAGPHRRVMRKVSAPAEQTMIIRIDGVRIIAFVPRLR